MAASPKMEIPATEVMVVGSGPNGLAAAIEMARADWPVTLIEGSDTIGGGLRSAALTLPGFVHDVCSGIHPLGIASPFLAELPLDHRGMVWIQPPLPLAHPLDDGTAAVLARSPAETGESLDHADGHAWAALFDPLVRNWDKLLPEIMRPAHLPRHPLLLARFGRTALRSADSVARKHFRGPRARALFAGLAGHSLLDLEQPVSAAFALILGAAGHAVGWPFPCRGAQALANAMADYLRELGGTILTGRPVTSLDEIRGARTILLDVTPRQLLALAGDRLGHQYQSQLARYRYGPGVCKVDWALTAPIPWQAPECVRAGTLHLGGTLEEIAAAERAVWQGEHAERPFVILAQHTLFDPSRAPAGQHTGWAYCHVPNGSTVDMADRIEAQVERFAPGFRDCILARHVRTAAGYEKYNPNCVGGDINGGVQDLRQLFTRPVPREVPYATGTAGLYLCSSSTPPGGGVHGMCGYHAARAALKIQYRGL